MAGASPVRTAAEPSSSLPSAAPAPGPSIADAATLRVPTQFKRHPGHLLVTATELLWQAEVSRTPDYRLPLVAIERQQVSKEGSAHVNLKIVPRASSAAAGEADSARAAAAAGLVFRFTGDTPAAALANRDAVVKTIATALLKARSPSGNAAASAGPRGTTRLPLPPPPPPEKVLSEEEIQIRMALLASNPHLRQLHNDLVQSGLVSEEEFWQGRGDLLEQQMWLNRQAKGLTSKTLAEIRPEASESSELRFTLTPEIIHAIFLAHPLVHSAYLSTVPDKLSQKEFWTQYFQSRYFHRQRTLGLNKHADGPTGRMTQFDQYLKLEEERAQEQALANGGEAKQRQQEADDFNVFQLLDLSTTKEDHMNTMTRPDFTMIPGRDKKSLSLIRRFNHHSEIVLSNGVGSSVGPPVGVQSGRRKEGSATGIISAEERSRRFMDETTLEDLSQPKPSHFMPLNIDDPSRYFSQLQNAAQAGNRSAAQNGDAAAAAADAGGAEAAAAEDWLLDVPPEKRAKIVKAFWEDHYETLPCRPGLPLESLLISTQMTEEAREALRRGRERQDRRLARIPPGAPAYIRKTNAAAISALGGGYNTFRFQTKEARAAASAAAAAAAVAPPGADAADAKEPRPSNPEILTSTHVKNIKHFHNSVQEILRHFYPLVLAKRTRADVSHAADADGVTRDNAKAQPEVESEAAAAKRLRLTTMLENLRRDMKAFCETGPTAGEELLEPAMASVERALQTVAGTVAGSAETSSLP
ncbi:hypothetical protein CXG81DRAFT_18806 [Caulochytrium protostelioides]|uniref:BSD domain-containing protein n=1 Tax=Caulochytrium protostelioides TaxID=1555241 RepID=A0A4P9X7Z8_9FUNG|nr:hypothetical protein CXG81DRAFT_18806 [Caulochytrium protostelioides]|eukprot:RKP01386.1 hypothetical protein CXG81DRAFT_18806 [Caulochytrium protostelioides]